MGSGVHVERGHLGVKETVEYLSSLDDHQLVWKYSPWVLRADHKVAMNIFVKRTSAHRSRRCCQHRSRPHSLWWIGVCVSVCLCVCVCVSVWAVWLCGCVYATLVVVSHAECTVATGSGAGASAGLHGPAGDGAVPAVPGVPR